MCRQAFALWAKLSDQRIGEIPLADNVHFGYPGDHELAADLYGANAERDGCANFFDAFLMCVLK